MSQQHLALVETFPLESIRHDDHLTLALSVFEQLIKKSIAQPLSEGEEAYYLALADLIETYEDAHGDNASRANGVALLRYLMDENNLEPGDLAAVLGTTSVVIDILAHKRTMTMAQVARLAEHFHLEVDAFMPAVAGVSRQS